MRVLMRRPLWPLVLQLLRLASASTILGAGPGTTGTRSVAEALVQFGFSVSHFGWYWNATASVRCPMPYANSTHVLGLRLCALRKRAGRDAEFLPLAGFAEPWGSVDAVLDSPIPEFFPYVFRLYPDARVILTTRRPETWVRSRSEKHGANAPVPVMNLFHGMEAGKCAGRAREGTHVARWPLETAALAYEFHNSYVRAVVPRRQLLDLDLFNESAKSSWRKLSAFLGRPVPAGACLAASCRFPELLHRANDKPYQLPTPKANLDRAEGRRHCRLCGAACLDDPVSLGYQPAKRSKLLKRPP